MIKMKIMVVLIALVGAVAYGQTQQEVIDRIVLAVQQGLILAFDNNKCPYGWEEYKVASGRFLIGAVPGEIEVGVPGGSSVHGHPESTTSEWFGYAHRKEDDGSDSHSSASNHKHHLQITETDQLPPHIGVTFCRIEKEPAESP